MYVHARHRKILDALAKTPELPVSALRKRLEVSISTLRRDLIELEEQGALVRVHGKVVESSRLKGEIDFERKMQRAIKAKRAIGRRAAELIHPGQTVFIDAGTTCLSAARVLMNRNDIHIMTNSVRIVVESIGGAAEITSFGGRVRSVSEAFVGEVTLEWVRRMHFDCALIGASALCDKEGPSTTECQEASIKSAVIERAECVYVLCDRSKWSQHEPVRITTWEHIDAIVTESIDGISLPKPLRGKSRVIIASTDA